LAHEGPRGVTSPGENIDGGFKKKSLSWPYWDFKGGIPDKSWERERGHNLSRTPNKSGCCLRPDLRGSFAFTRKEVKSKIRDNPAPWIRRYGDLENTLGGCTKF